jgi:hypothetical protein
VTQRLPTPAADSGLWGPILNGFLGVAHNADGTLKNQVLNVRDYGAVGDNTTDDRAAIQAAIDAASTAGGGTVLIPPGTYRVATELTPKTHVRLAGLSRNNCRINGAAGVLSWASAISDIEICDLQLVAGTGHVMTGSGYVSHSRIRNCYLTVTANNRSILYLADVDWIGNLVENCELNRPAGATVAGWYMTSNAGGTNANIFRNVWVFSGDSTAAPAFYLESDANGNWLYDNVFEDIVGEQNRGGLIEAYSVHGLVVRRCYSWDAGGAYMRDLIKVGKSTATGGLASRHVIVEESGRHGGTLNAGVYDINLVPGEVVSSRVQNCGHSSGTLAANLPADTVQINNAGTAGVTASAFRGPNVPAYANKTAAYTITSADGVVTADASGAAFTVTLPTAAGLTGRRSPSNASTPAPTW